MGSKLIRISLNRYEANATIIEYGEWKAGKLTQKQEEEIKALDSELREFSDFGKASELSDDERKETMDKKKRLEELRSITTQGNVVWTVQDPIEIDSVLLILQREKLPTYVENLPDTLMKKIMDPSITLNTYTQTQAPPQAPIQPTPPEPEVVEEDDPGLLEGRTAREITVIAHLPKGWHEFVTVQEDDGGGPVIVKPKRFLEDNWKVINEPLKARYGYNCWVSKGKGSGDRDAHWRIDKP